MEKNTYVMKNKRIGSLCGQFESDEEMVKKKKIMAQKHSMYESEQVKIWKEFGINREKWDPKYKKKIEEDKQNLKVHTNSKI